MVFYLNYTEVEVFGVLIKSNSTRTCIGKNMSPFLPMSDKSYFSEEPTNY